MEPTLLVNQLNHPPNNLTLHGAALEAPQCTILPANHPPNNQTLHGAAANLLAKLHGATLEAAQCTANQPLSVIPLSPLSLHLLS